MDTESSDFDSPDMNSSVERQSSPERMVQPRKLKFSDSPETQSFPKSPHKSYSPDISRIKALRQVYPGTNRYVPLTNASAAPFRLFDSPRTPKTLLVQTKFQKFLNTNHHDENCDILAKPIHDISVPLISNNNNVNKPKPFPLYNKIHDHLSKLTSTNIQSMIQ